MIIVNPQDLTPMLSALKAELSQEMSQLSQSVAENNGLVIAEIDALSVVNGEISTEVNAINAHTTTKTEEMAYQIATQLTSVSNKIASSELNIKTTVNNKSAIKVIHRITVPAESATVTIPAVVMSKATISSNWKGGNDGYCYVELISSNTVKITKYGVVTGFVAIEVIEYA